MTRSHGNMEIDARKLTRALAKNGYSIANAGVAMGRSKTYFDHILMVNAHFASRKATSQKARNTLTRGR